MWSWFSRKKEKTRILHINTINKRFCNNAISNTKYRWWNWPFLALYEQFSLHMNQYFLLLAILQLWRDVTPISPIATWTPLLIVVGLGILKELIDDIGRWRTDIAANNKTCCVLRNGKQIKIASWKLRVGDIVYVKENEEIRADMVLLKSSHPLGVAYVETSALDGERDYKERRSVRQTRAKQESALHDLMGVIECEHPNAEIDKFNGTITFVASTDATSLSSFELLLQGTFLKNTDWVYAVVVYTGNETKIGKNKKTAKIKWTRTDEFLNRATIFIFCCQLLIMASLGITGDILRVQNYNVSSCT
jgi:magnesium-transporting ATPase (P-type)